MIGRWFDIWRGWDCFVFPGTDALLDAGEIAIFGSCGKIGADGVQIHINHASADGGFIEQCLALETRFPESALNSVLFVGGTGNKFIEFRHKPAYAGQSLAEGCDPMGTIYKGTNVLFKGR